MGSYWAPYLILAVVSKVLLMKPLVKAYAFVIRVLYFLVHKLRIYPTWAKVYQWLHQRRYLDTSLPKNLTPIEAQIKMDKLRWRPDKAKEAWDAVGSAGWVQHCLNKIESGKPQPDGALDCDDFAAWAIKTIGSKYYPKFFGQGWHAKNRNGTDSFKIQGHAVCVIQDEKGKFFHCGNWGINGPYDNLTDASLDIIRRVDGGSAFAWCLYDKNMKLIAQGSGYPGEDEIE